LGRRVLVVEDEELVADLVSDALDVEGHETRCVDGETAMEAALDFQPEVVLLDLMMPRVDGFEVARRLHGNKETQDTPIVVMTAMYDAASRAAEVGTEYYLAKPFDIAELLDIVERAK
jgi:two-component system, OmpR family, response regulator VicR